VQLFDTRCFILRTIILILLKELNLSLEKFMLDNSPALTVLRTESGAAALQDIPVPNVITSPVPTVTGADKDSRYVDIPDLPSGYIFYPYQKLSIRRLSFPQDMKKLYHAHTTGNFRELVQVINATIDPDKSAFDLTAGDFYFLLYWHRIHSLPKTPLKIEFTCDSQKHLDMIEAIEAKIKIATTPEEKTALEAEHKKLVETLDNTEYLKDTNIQTLSINKEKAEQISTFVQDVMDKSNHHCLFYPARAIDVCDSLEMLEQLTDAKNIMLRGTPQKAGLEIARKTTEVADEDWLNQYASSLNPKTHGLTLAERRKWLTAQNFDADFMDDADKFNEMSKHGVIESVKLKCRGCGDTLETSISIDVASFFPNLQ